MPPRKDLCRNFQRGSCQYGDRCKFVHATPQESKGNPFGFGVQNSNAFNLGNHQQQTPNPFGFGVQNKSQSRGGGEAGSKPNQFKPFENKWTRSNSSNLSASRQPENQLQASDHKCTDTETCKRIIIQDLEKENPLWKLTCYAHNKEGPCDVAGDISSEELRALAYDEAKNGKSLQYIIERERSLLASKLAEFQNLSQKPYVPSSIAAPGTHNPFGIGRSNPATMNSSISPQASNFSQLNTSLNTSSAAAANYNFGHSSAFQKNNTSSQPPNGLQMNSPFNSSGGFGNQPPPNSVQNPFPFGSGLSSNSTPNAQNNPFSNLANSSQSGNMSNLDTMGTNAAPSSVGYSSISTPMVSNMPNANVDGEIWTKPQWKWNAGEIPENPPPDMYISG